MNLVEMILDQIMRERGWEQRVARLLVTKFIDNYFSYLQAGPSHKKISILKSRIEGKDSPFKITGCLLVLSKFEKFLKVLYILSCWVFLALPTATLGLVVMEGYLWPMVISVKAMQIFSPFFQQQFTEKIQTRIFRYGKHADHLTTTTAPN